MRRLTIVLAFIVVFVGAFSRLEVMYSKKFFDLTAEADWIWARNQLSSDTPVAFFAVREVVLPESRVYTHLKVAGDPEYTVYINGREAAARQMAGAEERTLDVYDVSELVRTGSNRFVIAVRAPQGVGGLLASIDIAPEIQNFVVTDDSWKIYRRWYPDLLVRDPIGGSWEPPAIIGSPPIGRWNFPDFAQRALSAPPTEVEQPDRAYEMIGLIPMIATREGIAVAGTERARATVLDFGFTSGRVRLSLAEPSPVSRVVRVRFANVEEELAAADWNIRPFVFAPGERTVTTPDAHPFRYVMAFEQNVTAEVVR